MQPPETMLAPGSALSLATRLMHPPYENEDPYAATAPPLYQTATFRQRSAVECGPYDYTRSGNPTRTQLEAQMADVEVRQQTFTHLAQKTWVCRGPYAVSNQTCWDVW